MKEGRRRESLSQSSDRGRDGGRGRGRGRAGGDATVNLRLGGRPITEHGVSTIAKESERESERDSNGMELPSHTAHPALETLHGLLSSTHGRASVSFGPGSSLSVASTTDTDAYTGADTDRDIVPYTMQSARCATAQNETLTMNGTLLTGFSGRDSYCGLDGCYRLTVTANTSESLSVSRISSATSFFEACGYRGVSLCV